MSTVIQSCPGCKSLILSDTDQCPECGHVFHERRNAAGSSASSGSETKNLKSATLVDPCPHCGEMVRTGLVRCWNCNGFMRADIAARYKKMTANPQPIIYSTIPPEQRKDFLPPRAYDEKGKHARDNDADGFVLGSGISVSDQSSSESEFELSTTESKTALTPVTANRGLLPPDGPDKPSEQTVIGKADNSEKTSSEKSEVKDSSPNKSGDAKSNEDDLLSIAMQDEREVKKRRSDKLADRKRKQVLVPCSCGAWIRVHESQAGKVVRCRKCKSPINVPQIRRKAEKKEEKKTVPSLNITWIEGIRFFRLAPTSIVLKPGSVADKFIEADIAITDSQIAVIAFSGGDRKKKGLLGRAPKLDRSDQRKQMREQIAANANFDGLKDVEVHTITAEHVPEIRLVQPILKANESMFAGVPVFGDGRIALFLPITLENGEQAYCSQALGAFRSLHEALKNNFKVQLPATENGVPETEKTDNLSCFINQSRVESIRDLKYYEQDPAFELELSGYRCKACSAVISEEGRLKNKLGGANGKAIAKAKCPKCSGKMGEDRLFRIKKVSNSEAASGKAED